MRYSQHFRKDCHQFFKYLVDQLRHWRTSIFGDDWQRDISELGQRNLTKKRDEHVGNFTDMQKVTDEELAYAFFNRSKGSTKEYFERVSHGSIKDLESEELIELLWSAMCGDIAESEEVWPF